MKSANEIYEIMTQSSQQEVGLALMYIEFEKLLFRQMCANNDKEIARLEGILRGILISANLLGVNDFYGRIITNLRNAIQDEDFEKAVKEIEKR